MNTLLQIYVACALIALLGVPLVLRRVKPNRVYGLATQRTLADAAVWDAANAVLGWALIAASAATALFLFLLPHAYRWNAGLLLAIFLLPLAVAFGATFACLRRITRPDAAISSSLSSSPLPPGTDP